MLWALFILHSWAFLIVRLRSVTLMVRVSDYWIQAKLILKFIRDYGLQRSEELLSFVLASLVLIGNVQFLKKTAIPQNNNFFIFSHVGGCHVIEHKFNKSSATMPVAKSDWTAIFLLDSSEVLFADPICPILVYFSLLSFTHCVLL